jgi:hypothetical protein
MRTVSDAPYAPHPAFRGLFAAYTSDPESIGAHLARHMARVGADDPLIVATGNDVAYFPGAGREPQIESFRHATRGFIEITSVSHLGTAVPWLARMRQLGDETWRNDAVALIAHIDAVLAMNGATYWRELNVNAWRGLDVKIADLVDYTCRVTRTYLQAALADESLLDFAAVRERFLDPTGSSDVPVPMDDMMAGTFGLAFIDIAQRIIAWLRGHDVAWERAMVLIAGQAGRPTAGLTWATNNMCHLLWRTSNERLVADRTLIAPFAPSFVADDVADAAQAAVLEASYRLLWSRTRASTEIGREMFAGYPAYQSGVPIAPTVDEKTTSVDGMPALRSLHDRFGLITRLRIVMEDPGQMVSNAAAHYVIDQLIAAGNDPAGVFIPGFTDIDYRRQSP